MTKIFIRDVVTQTGVAIQNQNWHQIVLFLMGVVTLNEDFILLPILLAFITTLYMVCMGGITPSTKAMIVVIIWVAILPIFFKYWFKKKDEWVDIQGKHIKSLFDVLKILSNASIVDDKFDIYLKINDISKLKDIQNSKDFKLLFQHLDSYTDIPKKYWKMVTSVKNAKKKLDELKECIPPKVDIKDKNEERNFSYYLTELKEKLVLSDLRDIFTPCRIGGAYCF